MSAQRDAIVARLMDLTIVVPVRSGLRERTYRVPLGRDMAEAIYDEVVPLIGSLGEVRDV